LERVKWTLWHGKPEEALSLNPNDECVADSNKSEKLADLYDYLSRNQAYLVNYQERAQQNQTYTSLQLNLTSNQLSTPDTKKSGKCNGLGREQSSTNKGSGLAMNGAIGGKNPSYPH